MLLTHELVSTIVRRNQLDLEAISDSYKSSKSISWMSNQVSFLSRLGDSLAEMIAKSDEPIGPLHALRVQQKVVLSLNTTIERKLVTMRSQNARRSKRQHERQATNKQLADAFRAVTSQRAAPVAETVSPAINPLLAQLGTYNPLAPKEQRDHMLHEITAGIDTATSKRQADELDTIFGVKPDDR
jgi:hypothetical protein